MIERKPVHRDAAADRALMFRRREFFRSVVLGALGYGAFSGLKRRGLHHMTELLNAGLTQPGLALRHAQDVVAEALTGGPALLQLGQALAAGSNVPAVFHIFYQTSHDIRHELNLTNVGSQYNIYGTGSVNPNLPGTSSPPTGLLSLIGESAPSPLSNLNMWAYQLLTTGQINGNIAFPGVATPTPLTADQVNNISVISAVGLSGSQGIHQTGSIPSVGNLEYVMQNSFANYSPIGAVVLDTNAYNAAGAVAQTGSAVNDFLGTISIPGVYMSRATTNNPVMTVDALAGGSSVAAVRAQMLQAYALLTQSLNSIQAYGSVATGSFTTFGSRTMENLAACMLFATLFQNGLATIGSVAMNSFDFHATDALRVPVTGQGNMLTEAAQALAGTFYIAQAAFAAQRDAIVYLSTCSNRSQDWTQDDSHVSTTTVIIKGSGSSSPFAGVPAQLLLLPDGAATMYAEAPSNPPTYSGADATRLSMTANPTVGQLEAGIVAAVGKAIGQTPAATMVSPAATII